MATQKRNLLNVDEILRIPSNKLLVNLRGNKPLLLDKIIYKEHPLFEKLKDSPITDYKPDWTKNIQKSKPKPKPTQKKDEPKPKEDSKSSDIGWDNF